MKAPFPIHDLDSVMNACIEYTRDRDQYIHESHIPGRAGVTVDQETVGRMFHWITKTDDGLLEDCGLDQENIRYFRLGHDAVEMMERGGFAGYVRRRTWRGHREGVRLWAPIAFGSVALVVSLVVLGLRVTAAENVGDLRAQVVQLQGEQAQLKVVVDRLIKAADATPRDALPRGPAAGASARTAARPPVQPKTSG